jgi:hypothetical protein
VFPRAGCHAFDHMFGFCGNSGKSLAAHLQFGTGPQILSLNLGVKTHLCEASSGGRAWALIRSNVKRLAGPADFEERAVT